MNLARMWWTLGTLLVIAAAIICLMPFTEIPHEFEFNDKVSHLIGHGSLALYFAGLVPRRDWWKIFAFLLLFGIAIEFAQYYMHVGRNGDPRDVIANSLGTVLGLLLARCGLARWPELAAWLLGRRTAE
jgi:glycopeptide antibiotics resistance protein